MESYPTPNIQTISDLLGYANYYTSGSFVLLMLIAVWFISFAWFKRYDTKTAISASTTLTFILSLPLSMITFQGQPIVAPQIVVILLVLTGISAIWLWKSE